MINLLQETLEILKKHDLSEEDVTWVGTVTHKITWDNFKKIANTEYYNGFGSAKVAQDLLIVGDWFWLERYEYDGAEEWRYKELPEEPDDTIEIEALTIKQAEALGYNPACGWVDLLAMNNLK